MPELLDKGGDAARLSRERAVDALMGEQHAALQSQPREKRARRVAQLAEVRQLRELIEGGNFEGHGGVLPCAQGEETLQICDPAPGIPPIAEAGMNMSCNPARRG